MGRAAKRAARWASDRARVGRDRGGVGVEPPPPAALPPPPPPPPPPSADVPRWLRVGAAWSWRLVLLAGLVYVAGRVASDLYLVIVPGAASLLLTALLQPLAHRLRRRGFGPLAATWCTLLLAFILIGAAVWLITSRVEAEYPALVSQVKHTTTEIQSWLAGPPFHIKTGNLTKLSDNIVSYLSKHQSVLAGTVLTGGRILVEVLAGVVLCFFISFFLIKDGDRIWSWVTSGLAAERRRRADLAGHAAWQSVVYYVRGTIAVAAIQATVMGITLAIINAPLVAPLALFMFVAGFIPLVGVLVAGTLAILIVLAAKGLIAAVIVLGILILMNQLEGHLLQPQVVGKMVRLHPLAVILVLAVAGVVAGIAGAVVAVPITAAITSGVRALQHDDNDGRALTAGGVISG
jgi:predicted PurR-regulated permease PerM